MDKAGLRGSMRALRKGLDGEEARSLSLAAQNHILRDGRWKKAASVGLYMAVRKEADTGLLARSAQEEGKRVFLPVMGEAPGVMRFLPWTPGEALAAGAFGIPEPGFAGRFPTEREDCAPEIVIVPGLAFDRAGRRLGSGGGYYDRLFAGPSLRDALRIGLAYAWQVVDRLPADPWDAPVHALATEEGLLWL